MKIAAIRGATTVNKDCEEEIRLNTVELIREIIKRNKLDGKGVGYVSAIVSTTDDIHSFYPVRAIRESGLIDAPFFSCAEPKIDGALPLCIRIMLTVVISDDNDAIPQHVYMNKAKALRPDLAKENAKGTNK